MVEIKLDRMLLQKHLLSAAQKELHCEAYLLALELHAFAWLATSLQAFVK